ENKREIYKAEARFLRAYDYFLKVQFYENVPLVVNTIVDPMDAALPRNEKKEIVEFVLKELNDIASVLPVANMRESEGHVTKGSALALKARLELYEGMYMEAINDCKAIMEMNVYELFP